MTLNRTQQPLITPYGALSIPRPTIQSLPNGAALYITNKGDQEVCRIDILLEGGRYAGATTAIADITGPMIRKGVPGMDDNAIAELLDYNGAWMHTATTQHYSTVSLFTLNRNLPKVLPLLATMLTSPTLPEKPFETLRQQRIQQLNISREKVNILAAEAFNRLIFGAQHPYARTTSTQDLQDITLNDIRQYHNNHYLNTGAYVMLSGLITDEVVNLVNEHLGDINIHAPAHKPLQVAPLQPEDIHTTIIHKEGSLQTGLRIGMPTISSNHPDYTLLTMANLILGGYFGSRLMTNIREEKGYTYDISSHIISLRNSSYFTIVTDTGTEYTRPLMDEVQNELDTLCNQLVSQEEVDTARSYMQGRRARILDSAFTMSDYFVSSLISNTPIHYFDIEDEIIRHATPADIQRVANTYLQPQNLYYAIAGDKAKMGL